MSPLNPDTMHRAEQDDEEGATSSEFHEPRADGSFTATPTDRWLRCVAPTRPSITLTAVLHALAPE